MGRNDTTSAVIESLLKLTVAGGVLTVGLLAPNAIKALDKPLKKYFDRLDDSQRQRELRRITRYMRSQGLLKGSYEHGLAITKRGRQRLAKLEFDNLSVPQPLKWDGLWRIVFYDVPDEHKAARNALTSKLRDLGFYHLQRSVLVHPFPCREAIEKITTTYKIEQNVSYIETAHIDQQEILIASFKKKMPAVSFK